MKGEGLRRTWNYEVQRTRRDTEASHLDEDSEQLNRAATSRRQCTFHLTSTEAALCLRAPADGAGLWGLEFQVGISELVMGNRVGRKLQGDTADA